MTSERDTVEDKEPLFTFQEGKENINGRYLRATYVKQKGIALYIANCIMCLAMLIFSIFILLNWQHFTLEAVLSNLDVEPFRSGVAVLAIPIAIFSLFFFSLLIAMMVCMRWPDGKGWSARDNAFAKWCGKPRKGKTGKDLKEWHYYFKTYRRYSMPVDVFEDKFAVYLPGGRQYVPYTAMYRSFVYKDLFVVRAYQKGKFWDIIIDLRGYDPKKEKEFSAFMKSKYKEFLNRDELVEPWIRSSIFDKS